MRTPTKIGDEITITGKWVPRHPRGLFRKSTDAQNMVQEWEDIHKGAKSDPGVLSTEINLAVGEDAVLINHVFKSPKALTQYFSTTATQHMAALTNVATPKLHMVRGTAIPAAVTKTLAAKGVPAVFGDHLFGFVKDDYRRPDPKSAIQVTAKWACKPDEASKINALIHWWQQVGTDAYGMEKGLLRFETYRVHGEAAVIVHETFENTAELQFHLAKGTAHKYKKDIDQIAVPVDYYFRGPVSWAIRTYSKFLRLPATYSRQGSHFTQSGGSMSEGTIG